MTFPYDKKEIQERISPHYGEKGGEAVGRSFCVSCKKEGSSRVTFCNVWASFFSQETNKVSGDAPKQRLYWKLGQTTT